MTQPQRCGPTARPTPNPRSQSDPRCTDEVCAFENTSRSMSTESESGRTSFSRSPRSRCSSTVASGTDAQSTVKPPRETVSSGSKNSNEMLLGTLLNRRYYRKPVGRSFVFGNTRSRRGRSIESSSVCDAKPPDPEPAGVGSGPSRRSHESRESQILPSTAERYPLCQQHVRHSPRSCTNPRLIGTRSTLPTTCGRAGRMRVRGFSGMRRISGG